MRSYKGCARGAQKGCKLHPLHPLILLRNLYNYIGGDTALGRPKKGEERNKAQDYRDECERVEVERKFSLGKRKCGMGLVTAKLEETAAHVVALSILLLNLCKIQCAFLQFWDWLLGFLQSREKQMVIQ